MEVVNFTGQINQNLTTSKKPLKPKLTDSEFCIAKFLRNNNKSVFELRTKKWCTYLMSESKRKAKKQFYKLHPFNKLLTVKKIKS